jgi:hypothetical protein
MQIDFPKPEVAVARITMQTWATRKIPAAMAAACGVLVAATPMILGPQRVYEFGIPFWGAVVTEFGLGAAVTLLVRKLDRTVVERRNIAINKILVHASWNWRLLSGEWESADEADPSWLVPRK